jgi:hypothetical protein
MIYAVLTIIPLQIYINSIYDSDHSILLRKNQRKKRATNPNPTDRTANIPTHYQ